jgi:ATP-dependent Clp protease adapter protein ClpS
MATWVVQRYRLLVRLVVMTIELGTSPVVPIATVLRQMLHTVYMTRNGTWRVVLQNDDVTSLLVVVHLVQTLCQTSIEQAALLAGDVHRRGSAEIGRFPDQAGAEQLTVALQRRGLHAAVRRS